MIGRYAPPNQYNYWLNINHPDVYSAYKAYCKRIGSPERYPLSDTQRHQFEITYLMINGTDHETPEWIRFQYTELMDKYACRIAKN